MARVNKARPRRLRWTKPRGQGPSATIRVRAHHRDGGQTLQGQHIKCQQSCCGRNREEPFSIWGGRGTHSGPKRGFVGFLIFRKQHRGGGGKHFPGGEAGDHPNADPPIPTQGSIAGSRN